MLWWGVMVEKLAKENTAQVCSSPSQDLWMVAVFRKRSCTFKHETPRSLNKDLWFLQSTWATFALFLLIPADNIHMVMCKACGYHQCFCDSIHNHSLSLVTFHQALTLTKPAI